MLPISLLPGSDILNLESYHLDQDVLTISVSSIKPERPCPTCSTGAKRVHSRYLRRIMDLPCMAFLVSLSLKVRRFFCSNDQCPRVTFAERFPAVVKPYARRTERLATSQQKLAFYAGGEAGARIAQALRMPVSPDTLLRLIRSIPDALVEDPRVIGIDDWALCKGQSYGTIIVDLERHQPIDLLPDRSTASVAEWLRARPTIAIISRDRAQDYIKAATEGAPQAVQVADRWHLLQNLRDAVIRYLDRNSPCLKATIPPPGEETEITAGEDAVVLTKNQQHALEKRAQRIAIYEQVKVLYHEGVSIRGIARNLRIGRSRVRKYVHAAEFPEYPQRRPARSKLDPFVSYLQARTEAGCHSGTKLYREICTLGYTGSRGLVARWLGRQKPPSTAPVSTSRRRSRPWASSRLAWLFVKKPADLTGKEKEILDRVLAVNQKVATLYELIQEFVDMVRRKKPGALLPWLDKVKASQISPLRGFGLGVEQDRAAVLAALSLPYSNGPVEGQINRLKLIKRAMYGRSNFDLLKKRVLERV